MEVMKCLFAIVASFCWVTVAAQHKSQANFAVNDSILKSANVIMHNEVIEYKRESLNDAVLRSYQKYTVRNSSGRWALLFNEYSSKNIVLQDVEVRLYDADGKQRTKFRKRDMATTAVGDGLIEDGYVTYFQIPTDTYPVTVEVSFEQKYKNTISIPTYRPLLPGMAVEESSFSAYIPFDVRLRHKQSGSPFTYSQHSDGKYQVHNWQVKNSASVVVEEDGLPYTEQLPHVSFATDQFAYYGIPGDLSSWKTFGDWLNTLYKDLDELPAERQQFYRKLVQTAQTDKEKIALIYKYLQNNFRYVSIQLGVGGLKPFSATFTDEKKYGDCKGLSNFMRAALKAVGIKSYVAIINADYNSAPVDPLFPANNFNHVILCVPNQKDTIWLECTSPVAKFGVLGTFTENRHALLVTEEGGVLVSTPISEATNNRLSSRTTFEMKEDFSGEAQVKFKSSGAFQRDFEFYHKNTKDNQKKILVSGLGFRQPDNFELKHVNENDVSETEVKLSVRNFVDFISGTKYFIRPKIFPLTVLTLPQVADRRQDFFFEYPFVKSDTTIITLPIGFTVEVLPPAKEFKAEGCYYQCTTKYDQSTRTIVTVATLQLQHHRIAAAQYKAVKNFFDEVRATEKQNVVLAKK